MQVTRLIFILTLWIPQIGFGLPDDGPVSGFIQFGGTVDSSVLPTEAGDKQTTVPTPATSADGKKKHLTLILSLLWEGDQIKPVNTEAIEGLRNDFPNLPIVQLLNPAYLTKKSADKSEVAQEIQRQLRPSDPVGLHLHGWKSLVEASGVDFRKTPTFWDNTLSERDCEIDCGHEVPISSYSEGELDKIFSMGVELLTSQGFTRPTAFAAGGWMDSLPVITAAKKHGMAFDLSGVPTSLEEPAIGVFPLFGWLQKLWPKLTPNSSLPNLVETYYGPVTQIYNNAGTIDYRSSAAILANFKSVSRDYLDADAGEFYFHLGFYHESAADHISRLKIALKEILSYAEAQNIPLVMFASQKP